MDEPAHRRQDRDRPSIGSVVLPTSIAPSPTRVIKVTFHRGFSAPIAGGEYSRSATFVVAANAGGPIVRVPTDQTTIQAALTSLGGAGIVEIVDNGTYQETLSINASVANGTIELRAADGLMPTLILTGELSIRGVSDTGRP